METISNDDVTNAFAIFCREQGFDTDKMANCFEMGMFAGFALVNQFNYIDGDENIIVKPRTANAIAALNGPHGDTVVRVWKARRYSFTGRLKAFWLKPLFRIGFMVVTFAAFVKDILR